MRTVLAALDASAAARPVLETALGIGELTGATVEAVHVQDGPIEHPEWLAAHGDVPLRILDGPVRRARCSSALAEPASIAAVFGARAHPRWSASRRATALHVLEQANKPDRRRPARSRRRRPAAVPTPPRAAGGQRAVLPAGGRSLCPLIVGEVELVVLHVFTKATVPGSSTARPGPGAVGRRVPRPVLPRADRHRAAPGSVGGRVAEVCAEQDADLVVLSWSQDSSPGMPR